MNEENPFRSPLSYEAPRARPIAHTGDGLWRESKVLVLRDDAVLPDRCMACNQPADGRRLKQTLYWHSPVFYLLILLNLIIYVIVAMLVRKSAKLQFGICERHQRRRRTAAIVGWVGVPLGVLGIIAGGAAKPEQPALLLAGVGLFLFSLLFVVIRRQFVSPKRIDGEFVWLKGVHRDYLEPYPDWTGPPEEPEE